jgi:hypothetical protein
MKHKQIYETPTTDVVEFKFNGIICGSDGDIPNSDSYAPDGNPFSFS